MTVKRLVDTTVRSEWESFAAAVMSPDAPPDQRREMRRAFYAGFWSMTKIMQRIGWDDIRESEALKLVQDLDQECVNFKNDVIDGNA